MPTWTRMASSLALVIAAWLGYHAARGGAGATVAGLVAAAMTLGWLGDLWMARLIPFGNRVLGGMGAFGLGHVAYIAALLAVATGPGPTDGAARWGAWLVWLGVGAAGWYAVVFRGQRATVLHWAALPYALLLASTAGVATALALAAPTFAWVAVGAALFLASDLLLAAELFNGLRFPLIGDAVWLLYGPGQMLIVYGILNMVRVMGA